MKRFDVEPTEEALRESIGSDRAGRNADVVEFVKLLSETEGPYAYMIDAAWGDGKTFFLKSIELVLRAMNPLISDEECDCAGLEKLLEELEAIDVPFLPFYFNAWDNDFAEDPVTELFASIAAAFDRNEVLKKAKVRSGVASVIDAGLAITQVPLRVSGMADALTSESLISAYAARSEVRNRIGELAENSLVEVANKLIIFIDELDRCRPDFAVRLLEQTKSLFASENIILVFAADSSQLAKAVGGMYGPGFDSARFLERFFDTRVTMTPVDAYSFANNGKKLSGNNKFDKLADELMSSRTLTIRDAYRLKSKLAAARSYCLEGLNEELPQMVASCTVLPLLVFIERDDIALFRSITTGVDFDALYEYGKAYAAFNENVKSVITRLRRNMPGEDQPEFTDADCKAYMHDLCVAIYGTAEGHPKYYESKEQLGGFYSSSFDARVYKQLKFDEK